MKSQRIVAGIAVGIVTALAAMGLVFCWCCPDWIHDAGGIVSHFRFDRQLAWNCSGVVAFGIALWVGWKRWLKAAPLVFAGWVVLWLVAHTGPRINGAYSYAILGPVPVEVWAVFPFAVALLSAWIAKRYGSRTKWILLWVCAAFAIALSLQILLNANRMERLVAWFSGEASGYGTARAFLQAEMKRLFESAHWFSGADGELKRLPCLFTSGAASAAAWLFGKWFVALATAFFATLALCFAWVCRYAQSREKRLFVLIWGGWVIALAINGPLQCLGLVPFCDFCMPMISFGGTGVFMTWMGLGVFSSVCMDKV